MTKKQSATQEGTKRHQPKLTAIADDIKEFFANHIALMQCVCDSHWSDTHSLASDLRSKLYARLRFTDIGNVARLDVVLRDMAVIGFEVTAKGLQTAVENLLKRLHDWEDLYRDMIRRNGRAVALRMRSHPDYRPEAADYLGRIDNEADCDALDEIRDICCEAEDLVSWMRQLVLGRRAQVEAKTGNGGRPETFATESPRTNGAAREYSPWIGSPEMIPVMKANGILGTGERNITRKKKDWHAEPQAGTNNQLFRFKLSTLRELGIIYPVAWDTPED